MTHIFDVYRVAKIRSGLSILVLEKKNPQNCREKMTFGRRDWNNGKSGNLSKAAAVKVTLKEGISLLLSVMLFDPVAVDMECNIVDEKSDRFDVVRGADQLVNRSRYRVT